jgi:hypothetical protein
MVTLAANWSLTESESIATQPLCHFWAFLWRAYNMILATSTAKGEAAVYEEDIKQFLLQPNSNEDGDFDLNCHNLHAAHQRRLFFSRNKSFIGLGPGNMEQNDVICVLFGGATPMILRLDGDNYRFIGECYVYDLMSGEAIQDLRAGKYASQTFNVI